VFAPEEAPTGGKGDEKARGVVDLGEGDTHLLRRRALRTEKGRSYGG